MSYVRLCDRCGRRLDGCEPKIGLRTFKYVFTIEYDSSICYNDLCKTCVDDLKKFLEGPSTGSTEEK